MADVRIEKTKYGYGKVIVDGKKLGSFLVYSVGEKALTGSLVSKSDSSREVARKMAAKVLSETKTGILVLMRRNNLPLFASELSKVKGKGRKGINPDALLDKILEEDVKEKKEKKGK